MLPIFGSLVLTAALLFWPKVPSPYGAGGLLSSLQNLFAILGGFFVSALTLVATASTPGLLQPLTGHPALKLKGSAAPLTRERFLALLFGYLAFSAFALYAVGFLAMLVVPGIKALAPMAVHPWLSGVFLLGYNLWLCHVFIAALVGLYYFTDGLQRPDAEVIRG